MSDDKLKINLEKPFKPKETKKPENQESISIDVADVAECFMNAAKSLHKLHLKISGSGSFAAHSALNGYDKFHEFADDLVEGFQGAEETLIKIKKSEETELNSVQDAISFLNYIKEEVTSLQSKLTYSEIINQLDVVKEHCNSMKYKLLFLK